MNEDNLKIISALFNRIYNSGNIANDRIEVHNNTKRNWVQKHVNNTEIQAYDPPYKIHLEYY